VVVVVPNMLDIVVVPVLVVVSPAWPGSVVPLDELGDEVSGGNSVAVELPVGVNLEVDVEVLIRRTAEVVVVGDSDVNGVRGGAVECREVCTTANTMRTTASTPATPAATMTGVCSYHWLWSGPPGRSSRFATGKDPRARLKLSCGGVPAVADRP
jgi:hypothetical protein